MANKLKNLIKGEVVLPGDDNYENARRIYNGMIDRRPAIIMKCVDAHDVIAAVNYAREHQIEVAIRSGGHNGAGFALVDNGLVIDLSEMKDIQIDPAERIGKIQPGNTLADVDRATHEHGLALPSGIVGSTGIGGITLGGGMGYLSRKGGLTIDNLIGAEIVLATGELVETNASNHSDLFWAIRGGGGNFGVVVSFTFKLLSIENVYGGPMFWPMEKASDVMKFYDKITANASNDLYGFFAFLIVPPGDPFPKHLHNQNMCGVVWCYTGPMEKSEDVFMPIREFGPPALDFVSEMPMPALNGMFDALYPSGMQWYWKAHFINELSDACIEVAIAHGSNIPSMHSTTHFYPIDGKVHDISNKDTAWARRDSRWAQVIVGVDPDPDNAAKVTQWCKGYYDAMLPFASGGGSYVNFMMDEGQDRIKASYGTNYGKLANIKRKYDPGNFFHVNQNITPTK